MGTEIQFPFWTSPLANQRARGTPSQALKLKTFASFKPGTPLPLTSNRPGIHSKPSELLNLCWQFRRITALQFRIKGRLKCLTPSLRNNQDQVAMWFHYLCNASKCHLSFNKRWQVLHVRVFYKSSVLILIHSIHTLLISDKRFITQIL